MRGALPSLPAQGLICGIIPADAGSTQCIDRMSWKVWDHPRGCGEHKMHLAGCPIAEGSSPRMRGARTIQDRLSHLRGIIPADAGST